MILLANVKVIERDGIMSLEQLLKVATGLELNKQVPNCGYVLIGRW